jgi:hypothetical protein
VTCRYPQDADKVRRQLKEWRAQGSPPREKPDRRATTMCILTHGASSHVRWGHGGDSWGDRGGAGDDRGWAGSGHRGGDRGRAGSDHGRRAGGIFRHKSNSGGSGGGDGGGGSGGRWRRHGQ